MRHPQPLKVALFISIVVHLAGFASPEWFSSPLPKQAPRLVARIGIAAPDLASVVPQKPEPPQPHAQSAVKKAERKSGGSQLTLPPVPVSAESAVADASAPATEQSGPPGVAAEYSAPTAPAVQTGMSSLEPDVAASAPTFDAHRLPRQGTVVYAGTAGAFIALTASGKASWSLDGARFKSRLSAGLSSPDSSLDFSSSGQIQGGLLLLERTEDNRRGKVSSSEVNLAAGKVLMQRGDDTRERTVRGLAVAISALPELLMMLDESVDQAAFFVVGDFWVADSILALRGKEYLRVPAGNIQTRHYTTKTNNGTLVDVWLAPAWRNAPARIRIESSGVVVDLKATSVEIEGEVLAQMKDTAS